eukprot:gene6678-13524_t
MCYFAILVTLEILLICQSFETISLWSNSLLLDDLDRSEFNCDDNGTDLLIKVCKPTLAILPPINGKPNRIAVIVIPGGGYRKLSYNRTGLDVAEWLSNQGYHAFVLKYRFNPFKHPYPLQDALQSIRLVRSNINKYRIDANKIGVLGFSAGGHLAACTGTMFDDPIGKVQNISSDVSGRPDFMGLIYPVISLFESFAHNDSRISLLGENSPINLHHKLSPHKRVTKHTPPTFIAHTGSDTLVPVENSIHMYLSLRAHKIPADMHILHKGNHGLGIAHIRNLPFTAEWPPLFDRWLQHIHNLKSD